MTAIRLLPLILAAALVTPARAEQPVAMSNDRSAASLNPLATLDEATLRGFVQQPLFEPSRRPPVPPAPIVEIVPPPAPPPPAVPEPPPMLKLLGVVEGSHSLAAIVRRADTGKTETLRPGDHLGSWTIAVLPTGLRVQDGDRVFDYAMFKGGQSGPQPVTAAQDLSPALAAREPLTGPAR